jgi:choline-phosphate cytidylyltransferase
LAQATRTRAQGRRVITYGTFDLLHSAHIDQLERARALGTYLIVAVLTDVFDAGRGKRFLAQDVVARCEAVRASGLADLVVLEEIDDKINNVLKYDIDVVAVFDSWEGPAAYTENLKRYCEVVYIPELEGAVSSTQLRGTVHLGAWGDAEQVRKLREGTAVTPGVKIVALSEEHLDNNVDDTVISYHGSMNELLGHVDAVYIASALDQRAGNVRQALHERRHVLCQGPIACSENELESLFELAADRNVVLIESLPSAFTPAVERMTAVAQNGKIGRVRSVDINLNVPFEAFPKNHPGRLCIEQLSEALLPLVRILHGREFVSVACQRLDSGNEGDPGHLSRVTILYEEATATITIGHGMLVPETLTVLGSEGYLTMPDPWRTASSFHLQFRDVNFEEASDTQDFQFATRRGGYRFDLADLASVVRLGRPQSHLVTRTNSIQMAAIIEKTLR